MIGDTHHRATRGHGVLESFLAAKRRERAHVLLRPLGPLERVLDIGCGAYPLMLRSVTASERIGIDQAVDSGVRDELAGEGIRLVAHDITRESTLPFESEYFDAVIMLAVIEHIPLESARSVVRDIHRVLKPGGAYVLTTPAKWADVILRGMARLSLVSAEEIDEHQSLFTRAGLVQLLQEGGFYSPHITSGTFELGMNLWARAMKPRT